MTPQEALAQAIHRGFNHGYHGGGWDHGDGDLAAAILDALPEGWALLNAEGAVMHTKATLAKGAQQERERLRAEFKVITAYGFTEDARRFVLARLADPEDDR